MAGDVVGSDAIVAATRDLLTRVPPSKLTRRDVAVHAGVAPALIRYYFNDLPTLLTRVLEQMMADLRADIAAISAGAGSPMEKLDARIRGLVRFLADNPAFHELFLERVVHGESEWAVKTRREFTELAFAQVDEMVREGRDLGEIAEDFDHRFLYIAFVGASEFFTTGRPIFQLLFDESLAAPTSVDAYAGFLAGMIAKGIAKRP